MTSGPGLSSSSSSPSLDEQLEELGGFLDAPSGSGVAAAVGARLRADHVGAGRPVGRRLVAGRRRWVVVVAGAAAAAVGVGVAVPAVADWFGVRGVSVTHDDPPRSAPTTAAVGVAPSTTPAGAVEPGASLDLGEPTTLAVAETTAGFAPMVPARLGPPDAVWIDRRGIVPFVSLVYEGGPLVSQFDATIAPDAVLSKFAREGATLEQMRIDGERAMWIEGAHEVVLRAPDGRLVPERLRLSDSVLLVQRGPLTVRIETAAGRAEAVRIAESLP